ncbi:Uncharacterised protein [Mycobacterium tuberculosis]|nr:Uncharacterised protein [Mycobacterium tuberculosis]
MSRIIRQAYARLPSGRAVSHASSAPVPAELATRLVSRRNARRRRRSENEPISTRLCALHRSMTLTVGSIADAALMSMLTRMSGSAVSRSSRVGIDCPAPSCALRTSRQSNRSTAPDNPTPGASLRSCRITATPSRVARTSVSM